MVDEFICNRKFQVSSGFRLWYGYYQLVLVRFAVKSGGGVGRSAERLDKLVIWSEKSLKMC